MPRMKQAIKVVSLSTVLNRICCNFECNIMASPHHEVWRLKSDVKAESFRVNLYTMGNEQQ